MDNILRESFGLEDLEEWVLDPFSFSVYQPFPINQKLIVITFWFETVKNNKIIYQESKYHNLLPFYQSQKRVHYLFLLFMIGQKQFENVCHKFY